MIAWLAGCGAAADTASPDPDAWYDGPVVVDVIAVDCNGPDFDARVDVRGWAGGLDLEIAPPDVASETHGLQLDERGPDGWWERWTAHLQGVAPEYVTGFTSTYNCTEQGADSVYRATALDPETLEPIDCKEQEGDDLGDCT